MAELSRFFDSAVGDTRSYTAAQFAAVLHRFIKDGVLEDVDSELAIIQDTAPSMVVRVGIGEAFLQGYWYRNTAIKSITLDAAHATLNRIDRIILRLDLNPAISATARTVGAVMLKGTAATIPTAPALTRTGTIYEMSLAQVYVAALAASVATANITDERYDDSLCGYAGVGTSKLCDGTITTVAGTKVSMGTGRNLAGVGIIAGKVYVVGGALGAGTVQHLCSEYDPAAGPTGTWTVKAVMPTARAGLMAAVVGGKLYAIGGYTDGADPAGSKSKKCEEYTPAPGVGGGTWATKTDMTAEKYGLAGGAVGTKIYCIGGTTGADLLNTVYEYDTVGNSWATMTPMTTGRHGMACGVVANVIYCVGGTEAGPTVSDKNEAYTPGSDTWASKTVMPAAKECLAAEAHGSQVYVFKDMTYKYDPVANTWTTLDAPTTSRTSPVAATVGDAIYLIGNSGSGIVNEAFDAVPHYICQSAGPKIVTIVRNSTTAKIIVDRGDGATFVTISAVDAMVPSSDATVRLNQWAATSNICLIG